jgi:hypothetical protein
VSSAGRAMAVLVGLGAVAAAAVWAFSPLETPDLAPPPAAAPAEAPAAGPVAALDLSAFRAPLWIAPPPPPPPVVAVREPEPPPPPPLKLQLLAIVREGDGSYRALVYDPDTDRLMTLAEGEKLGARTTVETVTAGEVRLRDGGRGLRTLALCDDQKVGVTR